MKLSIIICTHNRAHALPACLDSVAASIAHAAVGADAEIVVVDNASSDDTRVSLARWAAAQPAITLQIVHEPKKGLSNARNAGIRAARGDVIAFTDDDCHFTPEYVQRLLAYYAADDTPVMRGGSVYLGDPTDLPLTIKLTPEASRRSRASNSTRSYNLGDSLLGCNMALRRADALRIGDFDARLGAGGAIPAGEDIDYVMRAYLDGLTIAYEPDLVVHHFHGRKTPEQARALKRNYDIGGGALFAKYMFTHPQFLLPFYWDVKNILMRACGLRDHLHPSDSHPNKIRWYMRGMWLFYSLRLRGAKSTA